MFRRALLRNKRVFRNLVSSGRSAPVSVPEVPADTTNPGPGSLSLQVDSSTQITITHSGASDNVAVQSIAIQRSLNGTTGWTTIVSNYSAPYADTGRTASTQYFYRALVTDTSGNTATSSAVNATTDAASSATLNGIYMLPPTVAGGIIFDDLTDNADQSSGLTEGFIWSYAMDGASPYENDLIDPETNGGSASVEVGGQNVTTHSATGGPLNADQLIVTQQTGAADSDAGLSYKFPFATAVNIPNYRVGFFFKIGSSFAQGLGGTYKMWWVYGGQPGVDAEDRDAAPQVNVMPHPGGKIVPVLGYGGTLAPATDGFETGSGSGDVLNTPIGSYPFNLTDDVDEWFYAEFSGFDGSLPGDTAHVTFSIWRQGASPGQSTRIVHMTLQDGAEGVPAWVTPGNFPLWLRLSAYIQATPFGTADVNSFIAYGNIYLKDATLHTEGPPLIWPLAA